MTDTPYYETPCACGHDVDAHCTYIVVDLDAASPDEVIQWHECKVEDCDCEAFWREA